MAKSKTQIIQEIEHLIARNGGNPAQWYVGMAKDGKAELTSRHRFKPGRDVGAIRTAATEVQAQEVVDYLTRSRGCKGGAHTFNAGELHVYVYRMGAGTKP
ncbi:hypothetical protein [Caenispirillum salinarum]|uniref:hypothetical protein n=1 Tax=Caenispirillum salinarum TaxID=859058 RepID=UPI00384E6E87